MTRKAWGTLVSGLAFFSLVCTTLFAADESDFTPTPPPEAKEKGTTLPGGYFKMSGHYRMATGVHSDEFLFNEADANKNLNLLQGPNFRYLFGERLNNTYDPSVYSQFLLNIDFSPADKINFYTQIVNDLWSYVGTTGEQVQDTDLPGNPTPTIRYNLKYFGNLNATLPAFYRASDTDFFNIPQIKIKDGHTTRTSIVGILPGVLAPADHTVVNIPELNIDYDYRPIRKLWMDYQEDQWHMRFFALADETQAMTTDDPLELSNHKDYWQQSPWLYQYKPIQHFSDVNGVNSIKRGFYSDDLSYVARDSEGNRLVLLRGVSYEGDFGDTYFSGTVAAPFTPWDEHFLDADNVPGAFRIKRQMTDRLLLGGVYTFRSGLVDNDIADFNQVFGLDGAYALNDTMTLKSEVAFSQRQHELQSTLPFRSTTEGFAYKGSIENERERDKGDSTEWTISYTQMDRNFEPSLSRYLDTRDDSFWGNRISFHIPKDLEPFRLGDGIDTNRSVARFNWKEKKFRDRFANVFDVRNVHKTENTAYVETVLRDEMTYHFTPNLTGKGLFRWRGLPETTSGVEPTLTDLYFPKDIVDLSNFSVINTAIPADKNADQFTYSAALEYRFNSQWTAEGIFERTNAIPDFPRGLLNDVTKSANDRVDGLLLDHFSVFLYGQSALKAVPPYDYFNIVKERLVYKASDELTLTLHATQNGYHFSGGLDDNIEHAGLSAEFAYGKKWDFFADYTYSRQVDVPHLIASNFTQEQYRGHHNIYLSGDYLMNATTRLRAEYGVFGIGNGYESDSASSSYSSSTLFLPAVDTEHLLRASLNGDF